MPYSVRIADNYRLHGDDQLVPGFSSLPDAVEYARRRTRASIEELRQPGQSAEEVRSEFLLFGESCTVVDEHDDRRYVAQHDLDFFVSHPASDDERDWLSLEPDP